MNDYLDGGAGDDRLYGGAGSDTYAFGRGSGKDVVVESDATASSTDVAHFLGDISPDQLWFRRAGDSLEVSIVGTSDSMTIQDWYLDPAKRIERFVTTDNRQLLDGQIENLVQAMAAFDPPAAGQTQLPSDYREVLASVIAANWQ